jgi:hypothetical protein
VKQRIFSKYTLAIIAPPKLKKAKRTSLSAEFHLRVINDAAY